MNFLIFKIIEYDRFSHDYTGLREVLKIPEIASRLIYIDLLFLFKIINGLIDCPFILSNINFIVPTKNLRCRKLFKIKYYKLNYSINSTLNRICIRGNEYCHKLDFFGVTLNKFIADLRTLVLK